MAKGIYKRKPFTEQHKLNIKLARIGKKLSLASRKRISESMKGKSTRWLTGTKLSESHKANIKMGTPRSDKSPFWKGNRVGYRALHYWVERESGRPCTCEHCGKTGLRGKQIQWANKSQKYMRVLADWLRLCVPCHRKYDLQFASEKRSINLLTNNNPAE